MEKGLEITFQVPTTDASLIVSAISNIVGNEFMKEFEVQWRIFHVTLGKDRFYKVCFISNKLTRLHPHIEERVRKRFDELAHHDKEDLLREYREDMKSSDFQVQNIENKKEEYDLWQDNFWKYF